MSRERRQWGTGKDLPQLSVRVSPAAKTKADRAAKAVSAALGNVSAAQAYEVIFERMPLDEHGVPIFLTEFLQQDLFHEEVPAKKTA